MGDEYNTLANGPIPQDMMRRRRVRLQTHKQLMVFIYCQRRFRGRDLTVSLVLPRALLGAMQLLILQAMFILHLLSGFR